MRVVAGKYKGRTLLAPAGRDVRPTGDRVREAMFNLLAHGDYGNGGRPVLEGASVLDAFAGSGALGFEAISRGASRCVFMEITASTIDTLRKNADAFDVAADVDIIKCDTTKPPRAMEPVDLVFLDPPYRENFLVPAIAALGEAGWIGDHTLLFAELDANEEVDLGGEATVLQDRRYGRTRVVLFRNSN